MQQVLDRELPLYKIKAYDNYLFRVTKRLFTPSASPRKKEQQSDERSVGKFDSALSRAKNTVREVALCNRWEYFVTLTFDKNKWDRYSYDSRAKELMQWIQNLNKKGSNIKYLIVPEFHKDGAVHFHGLMSGIRTAPQLPGTPKDYGVKDDGSRYDCWVDFSLRYGFSSVGKIESPIGSGFYISKYITKSLAGRADAVGCHTYFCSRGLVRALEVGWSYHESLVLDKLCKFSNDFYKFGFVRLEDTGNAVDLCDEVSELFQNYIITDPVTSEVVGILGGDTDDIWVQEVLEAFKESGMCCTAYDYPD